MENSENEWGKKQQRKIKVRSGSMYLFNGAHTHSTETTAFACGFNGISAVSRCSVF